VKKSILVLAGVFVYLIAVMSCEIPQSITVKGKPGVYIPLGSPFANLDDEDRIENYVSTARIKEMMGNSGGNGVKVYNYTSTDVYPDVQTFVAHYPIAKIQLDASGVPINPPSNLQTIGGDYILEGTYPINRGLRNFLGSDVTFKEAPGYIYVDNVGSSSTMSLTFTNQENIVDQKLISDDTGLISREERPEFPESDNDPFVETLPPHSLTTQTKIDFDIILNANSDSTLKYRIKIPLSGISGISANKVITVDMVILLPLALRVAAPSSDRDYVKLDMGDALLQTGGGGDLFGRTGEDSDDDLLSNVESVKISLKNPQNTVIDGISILVMVPGSPNQFFEFTANSPPVKFEGTDLDYPFNPQFEIVLKKDAKTGTGGGYENYATLKIKRTEPKVFDFFLTVEAQANINQTIDF